MTADKKGLQAKYKNKAKDISLLLMQKSKVLIFPPFYPHF